MNKILLPALFLFSTTLFGQFWIQQNDAPVGRHHPISFSLDGKGYAVTGSNSNNQPTKDVYEYDPILDTWTTLTAFPGVARSFGIGTTANGKAYLGFGANRFYLNDFWSYDPTNSSWTRLADCSCSGRRHPAMIASGNKIYVGLGDDATGNRNDWWMYDITANTWTSIANLPGPARHHPFMFNAGGKVFAGLGHGNNSQRFKDWYKLDTVSNTWTEMKLFPGEARVAGTQFSTGDYGFVLSGDGDNHSFMEEGEMWRYDPNTDIWDQQPSHPGISIWAPGSFVIDDAVYFFGGLNRQIPSFPDAVWKFDMITTIGIEEQVLANTYTYPNPANDFLSWENDESITEVRVYNTLGQFVLTSAANAKRMDTQGFNNGLYLVQFYDKSKLVKTSKVLIQH